MPYALSGSCYETTADALQSFINSFPRDDGGGNFLSLTSATLNGATINYQVQQRAWTSNTLSSRTGSFVLQSCPEVTAPDFDPVSAGLIWTFFFSFVVSLWIVAKNAGVIINAIRKF